MERVTLRDFRSYTRAEVDLGERITVVAGPNGAGKTNLLEGLHFALTGRSCRTANEREMVRYGAAVARATAITLADDGRHQLEAALEPGRVKTGRIDGATPDRGAVERAAPPVGVFVPDRLELVKGPPAHRRDHLDRFLTAVWPGRAEHRVAYSRTLGQRNALLSRVRAGRAAADQLDAWDAQLARSAAALIVDREAAVEALRPRFAARAGELGLPAAPELRYRPRTRARDPEGIAAELAERRRHDLERGFTTHGPHRDDLALLHDGRSLRSFGSQGQQRLAVLALLFAERDILAARGRPPLLLLDDVSSELDSERRLRLAEAVRGSGQAVITATDPGHVPGARAPDVALVLVEPGVARRAPRAVAA